MSYKLDPRIVSKLRAFAGRRRKLIIIRGLAAALGMLLATMLLVAAIDFIFVLSDEVRWGLSAAAYLAVIITEWRTCLRLLAHAPGPRRLARLVEHAEPKLREDLLSAVELGTEEDGKVFDSPQFRALLQEDVAHRLDDIRVEQLLPVHLVKRTLFVAAGIAVAVLVLLVTTGFQLGTLMLRALLPGANLDRVSMTKVEILGPSPAEMQVPFGDAVPLLVKISGRPAREAMLETFTPNEGRQRVKLTAVSEDQFAGTVQVGREDVQYRVLAGDAVTRKYLLDAEPRPHVLHFTKTYQPPAYTKAAPNTVVEDHGDLVALEGSEVDLTLETNQPIKSAELRLEQGATAASTLPLVQVSPGRLTGKVPLNASGSYRVHLVGATTGFENKFSPEYELRAEPDLVPQVEISQPRGDLILPANDLVDLLGEATDDQGLSSVSQAIRVNDGKWTNVPLADAAGATKSGINRRWDLYELNVKAGDLITTKLIAVDLKGNRGESRPLQITVTSAGVEMKRLESLDALVALHESLKAWRQSSETLAKAASEARQRFEQSSENDPQRAASILSLNAAYAEFERQHGDTATLLAQALRLSPAGHQPADLAVLGRVLAKTEVGTARHAQMVGTLLSTQPAAPFGRDLMRGADDSANRATQRARMVEEHFRTILNSEEADLLGENAQILRREHQRLAELAKASGDDPRKWAQLGNRIRVMLSETKSLEAILTRLADRGASAGDRAKSLAKDLRKGREAVEKTLTDKGVTKDLLKPTVALADQLARSEKAMLDFRSDLTNKPLQAVKEMRQDVQPTWSNFDKLISETETIKANQALTPEARTALGEAHWKLRRELFKTHGDIEEVRPVSDAFFVSDIRSTTVALEALETLTAADAGGQVREKLTQLDRAFRILEGAHDLQEIQDGLVHLAIGERWLIASPRARTAATRDWAWLETRLRQGPDELNRLELREEPIRQTISAAQKILSEVQKSPAFKDAEREMRERRKPEHAVASTRKEAETLALEVKRALDLLRPHIDEARKTIAQLTPKLSELAEALARKTEELKQETEKQEETAKEKEPEQAKAEAEKALAEQEKLSEKLETLKDLIRADANKQDVMQKDQRERARDADDALAMLKDPPVKAEQALEDATNAQTKSAQEQALAQAAEQQQKLEQTLDQIAKHYDALEQGQDPQQTRTAMRAAEQELGIKDALDEQFARAEMLARMAESSPEKLIEELEKALPQNPMMQQELSSITQSTLAQAEQQLSEASRKENQIAQNLMRIAQEEASAPSPEMKQAAATAEEAAKRAAQAGEKARNAADAAEESARQAKNSPAAEQADRASDEAKEVMQEAQAAANAAAQMASAKTAPEMAKAAKEAIKRAAEAAKDARQGMEAAKQAQSTADQAGQTANEQQTQNQQSSAKSAEAAQAAEEAAAAAMAAQQAAEQIGAMAEAAQKAAQQMAQNPQAQPAPAPTQNPAGEPTAEGQPQPAPNPQLAQAATQQQPIGQMAAQAGADVSRAGRHEARLQNPQAGEQLQQLGAEIAETAMNEVSAAEQALQSAPKAAQAQQPVNAANTELAREAARLAQAAEGSQPAQPPPGEAQPPPAAGETSPNPQTPPSMAQATVPPNAQGAQNPQAGTQGQAPAPGQTPAGAASTPATPQEQMWMARTLDALDAALNAPALASNPTQPPQQGQPGQAQSGQPQPGQPQPGQPQQGQPQQGQPNPAGQPQPGKGQPSMAQAQAAMQQAAQAAAQAMRQSRSQDVAPVPSSYTAQGDQQAKSEGGAMAQAGELPYGATPEAKNLKAGEWGKLPKQMAEQLSRGQSEAVAGEYRTQVETYYRVIAERAKKQ